MTRGPPYVTRHVVYCGPPDPECGHHRTAHSAYSEIARQMWFEAEDARRVPKMPRGKIDDEWWSRYQRTTTRLARWLAWVDSRHGTEDRDERQG